MPSFTDGAGAIGWQLIAVAWSALIQPCGPKIVQYVAIRARLEVILLLQQIFELRHPKLEVIVLLRDRFRVLEPPLPRLGGVADLLGATSGATVAVNWLVHLCVRIPNQGVAMTISYVV